MSKVRELLVHALDRLKHINFEDDHLTNDLIQTIQKYLAQPEQTKQEPKGYVIYKPEGSEEEEIIPLYTAPQKRKPLSDDEMRAIWKEGIRCEISFVEIGRVIEKAHGIGVDDEH